MASHPIYAMVVAMTDLGSRSDLEALRRSGRGKVVTLMVVLALALGAAGWTFFGRKAGVGNPEDPAKVLVVGRTRGYSLVLDEVGFESAEGTFEAWEQKAHEEVPDLESTGIEAIMALADRFGYGYVVFEHPGELDFSALEPDAIPPMPEHVRFAAVSAGDLGFPPVITVNPEPSEVLSGSSVVLLQALFEQERLHQVLPDSGSDSIDAIQLRDRLREAVDRLAQVPEAEKMAQRIVGQVREQLIDDERAEPKPGLVGEALESGSPFPLANGSLLTISRGFKVVTRDAVRADLDLDDTERLLWGAPGAAAADRAACEALGGAISVHESPRYSVSADGRALLLQTLGEGFTLYGLDPAAAGCPFTSLGTVPAPASGLGQAVPGGHGQVARAGMIGGRGVVSVVTAGQDDELMLGMLDAEPSAVAWLSDRHLAAVVADAAGSWIYLFDTQAPLSVLRLPGTLFENADVLHEVAAGSLGARPTIVVTAGSLPRKVYRLDLPADLSALFSAPPVDDAEAPSELAATESAQREAAGLPVVTTLDPNRVVATALTHEGSARELHVSADGRFVVFGLRGDAFDPTAPGDAELAVVPTAGGSLEVLTRNALRDHSPRLTASGSHVVFQTRVEIPRTDWVVSSPRIVAVPQ